jgi:hypothetical protein
MTTQSNNGTTLAGLMAKFEDIWRHSDTLFNSLSPEDQAKQHAKGWLTFGDLPYHMAYFDHDLVANGIQLGDKVPESQLSTWQQEFRTLKDVDRWNEHKFAERPEGQTFEQAMEILKQSHDSVREAVSGLTDANLEDPVYLFLPGAGWKTVRFALCAGIMHSYNHLTRTRLRLHKSPPPLEPGTVETVLNTMFCDFMPNFVDRELAEKTPLTAVMSVKGAGGGHWTLRVNEGRCQASVGQASDADLVMTYANSDAFARMMLGLQNPMLLMLTGKIRVKGFGKMGTFGKLFSPPKPDQVLQAA